jgi:hypothetical protein
MNGEDAPHGSGLDGGGQPHIQLSVHAAVLPVHNIGQFLAVLRIRDVYPGSRIMVFTHPGSRIPDPRTATKERGEKKLVVIPCFVTINFTKLKIILYLKCWRKKFGPIFKEL